MALERKGRYNRIMKRDLVMHQDLVKVTPSRKRETNEIKYVVSNIVIGEITLEHKEDNDDQIITLDANTFAEGRIRVGKGRKYLRRNCGRVWRRNGVGRHKAGYAAGLHEKYGLQKQERLVDGAMCYLHPCPSQSSVYLTQ